MHLAIFHWSQGPRETHRWLGADVFSSAPSSIGPKAPERPIGSGGRGFYMHLAWAGKKASSSISSFSSSSPPPLRVGPSRPLLFLRQDSDHWSVSRQPLLALINYLRLATALK